jgi:hypothetical protein
MKERTEMNRLKTYGNVMISTPTDTLTLQDVRDFVDTLEALGVPNTNILLDGFLTYEYMTEHVQVISCGEHNPNEPDKLDFLIPNHECVVDDES